VLEIFTVQVCKNFIAEIHLVLERLIRKVVYGEAVALIDIGSDRTIQIAIHFHTMI
jgi:hypothetical protein